MSPTTVCKTLTLAATVLLAGPVMAASDWTAAANQACNVLSGNTNSTNSGLRAVGGTAVIGCPITKKVGGNNLNWVYARIKRANGGGPDPFCTLNAYNSFSSASSTTVRSAPDGAGNKSLSLPMPASYSTGYLTLGCVLNANDVLYGFRYGQD